jgi:uncharacterized RDD family membrane protein YckC/predicted Ser/Thr protein kinase
MNGNADSQSIYVGGQRPADDDLEALPPGTLVSGRYEILGRIGSGGFGIVYEAKDHQARGQVLALKEYFPAQSCVRSGGSAVSARNAREREVFEAGRQAFLREARLLRDLEHPGVVRVYDWLSDKGTVYIVMKRLKGRTLQSLLEANEHPDEATLRRWLECLLSALEAVHTQGVLHRDVSPRNVFVTDDGQPVLIDFGAARQSIGKVSQALSAIASPGYSPIEQYDEHGLEEQGPPTDLYALGATFYHLVSGSRPLASTSRAVKDRLRPAAEVAAGHYGANLLAGIDRAMAVVAEQRWPDAAAWRTALAKEVKVTSKAPQLSDPAGLAYGRFWRRFGAYVIDSLAFFPLGLLLSVMASGMTGVVVDDEQNMLSDLTLYAANMIWIVAFWLKTQSSPGKMALSLRIVDEATGGPLRTGQAIGRYLAYLLSALPMGLGFLWVAWDPRGQAWHDKLAGTLVLAVPRQRPTQ